jgi:hypothetical protein
MYIVQGGAVSIFSIIDVSGVVREKGTHYLASQQQSPAA